MQTTYSSIRETYETTKREKNRESKINSLITTAYQLFPVPAQLMITEEICFLLPLPHEIERLLSFFASNQPCNQQGGAAA